METLDELINILSDPEVSIRNCLARASGMCKLCGEDACNFRDAASEFEYRVSAICQNCQDKYFRSRKEKV